MTELDPTTAGVIRDLARQVRRLDRRVRDQARASQARDRSVEGGAQYVYDEDDELRAVVGLLEDGQYGVTTYGGEAPLAPSRPLLATFPGGATLTWDGFDENDEQSWGDTFARVTFHLSTVPGADDQDVETQIGSSESRDGGSLSFAQPADVTTYATLVAWTSAGVPSLASEEVVVVGGAGGEVVAPPVSSPSILTVIPMGRALMVRLGGDIAPSTTVRVEAGTGPDVAEVVASAETSARTVVIAGLDPGVVHWLRAVAFNELGEAPVGVASGPWVADVTAVGSAILNELTVLGQLAIRGVTNEISKGSTVAIASSTTAPKSGPVLEFFWPESGIGGTYLPRGYTYHTATANYYHAESVLEGLVVPTDAAGTVVPFGRTDITGAKDYGRGAWGRSEVTAAEGGVAISGNTMFVLCRTDEPLPGTYRGRWYVYRGTWDGSKWQYVSRWLYEPEGFLGANSPTGAAIGVRETNGNVLITQCGSGNGRAQLVEYTPGGAVVSRQGLSRGSHGFPAWTPGKRMTAAFGTRGDSAVERIYVVADGDGVVRAINPSTGVEDLDHSYPLPVEEVSGAFYDTATGRFRSRTAEKVYDHTSVLATRLDAVMTWRRSGPTGPDDAVYETDRSSPSTLLGFPRRAALLVTTGAAIPMEEGDPVSADAVSFYLAADDQSGTNSSYKRQPPPAPGVTVQTLTALASGLGVPPLESTFPAALAPARIYSAAGDDSPYIDLEGDGTSRVNGMVGTTDETRHVKGSIAAGVVNEGIRVGAGVVAIGAPDVTYSQRVNFSTPFPAGTNVVVLTGLADAGHNTARLRVAATAPDAAGFTVQGNRDRGTGGLGFTYTAYAES